MGTKRKLNKSKEWIIEEYVIKKRKRSEVAKECGLTEAGFKSVLNSMKIYLPKLEINKEKLLKLVLEGKNIIELTTHFNCSKNSIRRALKKIGDYKIAKVPFIQYDDSNDELIVALYNEGISTTQIAKELGVTHSTILTHLKHCGIQTRNYSEAQWAYRGKEKHEDLKNRDIVYDLYINQKLSKKDLAVKYECTPDAIDYVLKEFNIPIRGNSEAKYGISVGDKHPNWKGGITSLYARVREYNQVRLNPKILERDNNTCKYCGSNENLCVHHKIPFLHIIKEILNENSHLDPKTDVNKLYDIITNDSRINDLDNLETCCKECHLYTVHNYQRKEV